MLPEGYQALEENKIDKALRNSKEFIAVLKRASKGEFDEELTSACGLDLLKVTEKFVIREQFCLDKAEDYYKLYKEVYYVEDPHKYYFETVEPTIYRRIAGQKETGDIDWAKKIAKEYGIEIVKRDKKDNKAVDAVKA